MSFLDETIKALASMPFTVLVLVMGFIVFLIPYVDSLGPIRFRDRPRVLSVFGGVCRASLFSMVGKESVLRDPDMLNGY